VPSHEDAPTASTEPSAERAQLTPKRSHMGLIYDPITKEGCKPRFKYHQWADEEDISDDIKGQIETGSLSVITVKVDVAKKSIMPDAIEKYLLSLCVRKDGDLPLLNKEL
ncbi:MAG: hypothetical protein H7842_15350, partial [Gammaproteobacteria bacterium SHHR-1]